MNDTPAAAPLTPRPLETYSLKDACRVALGLVEDNYPHAAASVLREALERFDDTIEYAIQVRTSLGPAWVRATGHTHATSDDSNHCDRFATSAQADDCLQQLRSRYPGNRFEVRPVPKRVEDDARRT